MSVNTKPVSLSLATLRDLPENVAAPKYAREDLSAGILHFGVGNFHRSHQAVYLDLLMNKGLAYDWALVGAGVFAGERKGRDVLEAQDWLTTVVEQSANSSAARVTGPMIDFVTPADPEATVARMIQADIRIVSLTITEGGYFLTASQDFDADHPDMQADAAAPDAPKTVFGMILLSLKKRRAAGLEPFTIMCCDNIPHNGDVTRRTLVGLAKLSDPDFAAWVDANVAFPNSMVDRITPATSDYERNLLKDQFGVEDQWPVFCEDFIQWVMEDDFPTGRPSFEDVGVTFTDQVAAYELMKLRILNGGHAMLAYPSGLLDIEYAHEGMQHTTIRSFLRKVAETEVIPTVPPVPNTDLNGYFDLIETRFSNPKVADTIRRLCLDGSNRQPKFIIPTLRDALAADGPMDGLALACALWCRYCAGTTDSGADIAPNDPSWDALQAAANAAKEDPSAWLAQEEIYGDLSNNARLQERFAHWLGVVWADGVEQALNAYIAAT